MWTRDWCREGLACDSLRGEENPMGRGATHNGERWGQREAIPSPGTSASSDPPLPLAGDSGSHRRRHLACEIPLWTSPPAAQEAGERARADNRTTTRRRGGHSPAAVLRL